MQLFEKLEIPIIQAPMLGASTLEMALAVSRAGGLGSLAAGGLAPDALEAAVARLKAGTDRPFAVNLLMVERASPSAREVEQALEALRPWYKAQELEVPAPPNDFALNYDDQFGALVRSAPSAASFAFSILTRDQVTALHAQGTAVIGTATTVAEAKAWAEVGADAICAQGSEAGGHRGHFLAPLEDSLVGTMALVATIRAAVNLPVIAAGGIMDGRGVAAALALGAVAAQMGTAFLLADQTMVSAPWRRSIETAKDDPTRLTRAFTGRYARGIENEFMRRMRPLEHAAPDYPVQNRLTQPLRAAAAARDDPQALSLWAGQAVKLAAGGDAGALVEQWWSEAKDAAWALVKRTGG
ncbi:MAG TPA: nitronate monooxygenase [Caulobacteraceae bacterium]|jgi:nitronate monooxygenase|nr:nitronate monooxygenase [Caulobacteraceae bacterium]